MKARALSRPSNSALAMPLLLVCAALR